MSTSLQRIGQERKLWRKDHPFQFTAKPKLNDDKSSNMNLWDASIPGPSGTVWEGAIFNLTIRFPDEYPVAAPKIKFVPVIYHPNVFSTGAICLSILNADWKASITIKELLLAIQLLLIEPNAEHQTDRPEISELCRSNPKEYEKRLIAQTKKFTPAQASDVVTVVTDSSKKQKL